MRAAWVASVYLSVNRAELSKVINGTEGMDETGYFKQSLQLGISDMVRHKTGHFRHGAARNWAFPKVIV